MKLTVFLALLMSICLLPCAEAFGQSDEKKTCEFKIAGMWRSDATSNTNPVFYGFRENGSVKVLGHVRAVNDGTDGTDALPQNFEVRAMAAYKLDDPAAPKRIDFKATRGGGIFRTGTTSMEITQYSDDSFTTLHAESGTQIRWDRVQTRRYFLTFATRSDPAQPGGAAFAMWTKLDGRKTEIEALGVQIAKDSKGKTGPVFGLIPSQLYNEFATESDKKSDLMLRLEMTEAEFERSYKVFKTWEKQAQDRTLPHRDPYLNGMEFLKSAAESLNQCDEKLELQTTDAAQNPQQETLEYVRVMKKKNNHLHIPDRDFPTDWKPTVLPTALPRN
ncbi:MAG TPA: hypothetical protein VJ810_37040 [Blastocatellia bacterium]|nr:hypothetical protein [Blastocatellia bacterium]